LIEKGYCCSLITRSFIHSSLQNANYSLDKRTSLAYYDRVLEAVEKKKVGVDSNSMLLCWVFAQKIWCQIQQFTFTEEAEIAILKDIQTLENILPHCGEASFQALLKLVRSLKAAIYHLIGQAQVSVEIANTLTRDLISSNLSDYTLVSAMCVLITTQIHLIYEAKGFNCLYELQLDYQLLRVLSKFAPILALLTERLLKKYPNIVSSDKISEITSDLGIFPDQLNYPYRVLEWIHMPTQEESKQCEPQNQEEPKQCEPQNQEEPKQCEPQNQEEPQQYQPENKEESKQSQPQNKEEPPPSPVVLDKTDSILEEDLNDIFLNWTQHTNLMDQTDFGELSFVK